MLPLRSGRRRIRIHGVHELDEGRTRQRGGKDKTLHGADALFAQVDDLFEILHTFGDDVHAQVAGELDQGPDDGLGMRLRLDRFDEQSVDLDDVDAELEDVGEAAMAGADVVEGDPAAKRLQGGNDPPCSPKIS